MIRATALVCLMALVCAPAMPADESAWLTLHRMRPPEAGESGLCTGTVGTLPDFRVTPATTGNQIVRLSLPFAPASLPLGLGVSARCEGRAVEADLRALTRHPGQPASVRRGILTFPFNFTEIRPHGFTLELMRVENAAPLLTVLEQGPGTARLVTRAGTVLISADAVSVEQDGGAPWEARLIAPARTSTSQPEFEIVEQGEHFLWVRLLAPDNAWPRIIEVRLDALGGIAVWGHIQRLEKGNATADDLGWALSGLNADDTQRHTFANGAPETVKVMDGKYLVRFPRAPGERRGYVEASDGQVRFLRCEKAELVPFQESAWRSAAFTVDPAGSPERNALQEYTTETVVAPEHFDALYRSGLPPSVDGYPVLDRLLWFTRRALTQAAAVGDDFGNVTSYAVNRDHGAVYGMNRLNHCPPIFFEAWRSGDRALRDTAVLWCENMQALSLWWGEGEHFGGTRYNNAGAAGQKEHADDPNFMWRTNDASTFCTKGLDTFFLAYEETGDPRMAVALEAQVNYARKLVHVNTGEARNIGDAADFMALYRYTGKRMYLEEALRLFGELRERLGPDHLFSQGGQPIVPDLPFIDDDAHGYETPYGKPYIMGYALAGLPSLLEVRPETERLPEVVRAVAAFQASAQDPAGGWRYPHPKSSAMIIDQGMEHIVQLARAAKILHARGEEITPLLDAIERGLRARVLGYAASGNILCGLGGWEKAAGMLEGKTIYDLYAKPADRDPSRDYTEGPVSLDYASPEGLAHFFESLHFYLAHRPAERLFHAQEPLKRVIERLPQRGLSLGDAGESCSATYMLENTSVLGVRLELPEAPAFVGTATRTESATAREMTQVTENEKGILTSAHAVQAGMAEFAHTFSPRIPGVAGVFQILVQADFSGAAPDTAPRAFIKGGPAAPGALPGPGPLLLMAPLADGKKHIGLFLPEALSWNMSQDLQGRIVAVIHLPLRGDGPTTLRGFVLVDEEEAQKQSFQFLLDDLTVRHAPPSAQVNETAAYGMRALLPAFHEARIADMKFPLAWRNAGLDFPAWRQQARKAYLDSLQQPPPQAPFATKVLAVEDRGTYEARKLALNISANERVSAYLLVPKGTGPFPAMLALHDHGAHFSIGKEKVVRPFGVDDGRAGDAQHWADQYYGARFIGDALAERGYVVFAADALFWGDRGRAEGVQYEAQQELAANLLQLGQTWAGVITWDDLRSAQFLQGLPEVNPERIGCIGLSMGAHRAWNLCAATDIIRAGAAICWLGDTPALMAEDNNQTRGQSAFSMIHPGLRNFLDYPDAASIACPKPMLFYNGSQDELFPVPGVEAAYALLRQVYAGQGAEGRLETRIWDVPHLFNLEMQQAAFDWLDKYLK